MAEVVFCACCGVLEVGDGFGHWGVACLVCAFWFGPLLVSRGWRGFGCRVPGVGRICGV